MNKILDWKKYEECAIQTIAEGCVLLTNNNNVLPLNKTDKVSVFGRIQTNYYKSGTGSGGMVNVDKVYNIVEGLELKGVQINQELKKIYEDWEKENPYDAGIGWEGTKWSQKEMPLSSEVAQAAAAESDIAIVIIGRTAGEEKDNKAEKGSYYLSDEELMMMQEVRKAFKKMVVLLNVGNIIDMGFAESCKPDSIMYVWQGGMLGGLGTAQVLTGEVNPCGKLTDTIAKSLDDYPSSKNFGNPAANIYSEDIFVGYRYFETFAKDKVLFPFGFGLSYTNFNIESLQVKNNFEAKELSVKLKVSNCGKMAGKEVAQIYMKAPQGKLGKADKVLVDFEKTALLKAGQSESIDFIIPYYNFASYDDSGITKNKSCWLLEAGKYQLFAGSDVRSAKEIFTFNIEENLILTQCEEVMAPVKSFKRFHAEAEGSKNAIAAVNALSCADENINLIMEDSPSSTNDSLKVRLQKRPADLANKLTEKYRLEDVYNKKISMEDFVSLLSDEDLSCLIRGEGMGSSLVTAGTASAFGGVSPRLREEFGIPVCCCDDGPSGMRLDCGIKAFSLPNGTSIASTFNKELVKELYSFTGLELVSNKVENLLGPGMNIHRHPLNGRNFEYFSEDPYLTGQMGSAMVQGLQTAGVTGTIKHFCANNQETNRRAHNSIVSERALREIYLKGFEIAVKKGADSVMTTYGMVNGLYTAGNYDLCTTVLRKEWGFKGIVMTDWWADINTPGGKADNKNFAQMIGAQNDLYMVCPDGSKNTMGDNTLESLEKGKISRGELQRNAINICNFVMKSQAMQRLLNTQQKVEIINKKADESEITIDEVKFIPLGKELTYDLTYKESKAKTNFSLPFDVEYPGTYEVSLTASSDAGQVAQLPVTIFYQGIPMVSMVFNGSKGQDVSITQQLTLPERFSICRLYVGADGLKIKNIHLKYLNDNRKWW